MLNSIDAINQHLRSINNEIENLKKENKELKKELLENPLYKELLEAAGDIVEGYGGSKAGRPDYMTMVPGDQMLRLIYAVRKLK